LGIPFLILGLLIMKILSKLPQFKALQPLRAGSLWLFCIGAVALSVGENIESFKSKRDI